jgi:hypothetical protein
VEVPSFEIFFHGSWDLHYYGIERRGGREEKDTSYGK